jgi:hypothetical protein
MAAAREHIKQLNQWRLAAAAAAAAAAVVVMLMWQLLVSCCMWLGRHAVAQRCCYTMLLLLLLQMMNVQGSCKGQLVLSRTQQRHNAVLLIQLQHALPYQSRQDAELWCCCRLRCCWSYRSCST